MWKKIFILFILLILFIQACDIAFYNPFEADTYSCEQQTPFPGSETPDPTPDPTPTPTLPTGKNQDYTYIRSIDITESSGNNLIDYQVLIELNTGNFNYSNVGDPDGNDIRFDIDDTDCSYWIETWNTSGDSKIWVKIPALDANQTKVLYMFYGYASATAVSNGDNTFLLFDDFNDNIFDSAKWTNISQNPATVMEQNQMLFCKLANPQQKRGFVRSTNEISETNIALHFSSLFVTTESSLIAVLHFDGTHSGDYDYPNNGFNFDWSTPSVNKFLMDSFIDSTATRITESAGYSADLNLHNFQFRYYNQSLEIVYDDSVELSGTSSQSYSTTYIGLASREIYDTDNTSNTYFDNVFVRKYTSPDPVVTVGQEELNP